MKNSIRLFALRLVYIVWLMVLTCFMSQGLSAQSTAPVSPLQGITQEQTRDMLAAKVHLKIGATQLSEVMKALSKQTGLQIAAASYLREHRLTMYMDDVSAATVLTSLCELNDWKWEIVSPGEILVGFPQIKTPAQLTDLSLALQAAMPKDFRRFVGSFGALRDAMYSPSGPVYEMAHKDAKSPVTYASHFGDSLSLHKANLELGQTFLDLLSPSILDQKPLRIRQLTVDQQRLLIAILTLSSFAEIFPNQHNLLNGVLRPHQRDIANVDLFMKSGNALMLGTTLQEKGHFQFAGGIYRVDAPSTSDKVRFP